MEPPFISKVLLPSVIQKGIEASIGIQGNWPNPGWSHKKTEKEIDSDNKRVTIKYLGESKGGIAMQVLKPFTAEISLTLEEAGKWKIIVKGRGNNQEETVIVEEKQEYDV